MKYARCQSMTSISCTVPAQRMPAGDDAVCLLTERRFDHLSLRLDWVDVPHGYACADRAVLTREADATAARPVVEVEAAPMTRREGTHSAPPTLRYASEAS